MTVAALGHMTMDLPVLKCGNCEPLKLSVHAAALGLAALMGAYNGAAWLSRRQRHLAVNTVLYTCLTIWEQRHVAHHLATLRSLRTELPPPEPVEMADKVEEVAAVAAVVVSAVLAA